MVFNRHLKALNLCNHSDTIACVLYELLVNLELFIVSFQNSHQGSTSFSFVQFSRSCWAVPWALSPDSLYIIPPWKAFVNTFFQIFLQSFDGKFGQGVYCGGWVWRALRVGLMLAEGHNPSVTAAPCHLPLHKGGFSFCSSKNFPAPTVFLTGVVL